jgi:ABC-type transporter Mla MlaB component
VVFSLFSRRDKPPADARRAAPSSSRPAAETRKPASVSVERQRAMAQRAAEQIDRIESEMIAPPPPRQSAAPAAQRPVPAAGLRPPPAAVQRPAGAAVQRPATAAPAAQRPAPAAVPPAQRPSSPAKGGQTALATPEALPDARPRSAEVAPLVFEYQPRAESPASASPRRAPADTAHRLSADNPDTEGIQVTVSALPPDLEEAAILFANEQAQAAADTLESAIARDDLGDALRPAWRMLLDILQYLDRRPDFDARSVAFAARFETSPPAWRGAEPAPVAPRRVAAALPVSLGSVLGPDSAKAFEQARRAQQQKRAVILDVAALTRIEPAQAAELADLLELFIRGNKPLTVRGAQRLAEIARGLIETGRPDADTGAWRLALTALRLLGEQQAFEDLSIDYCVTYEVSPPSWEPVPPQVGISLATDPLPPVSRPASPDSLGMPLEEPAAPVALGSAADADALHLRGELAGLIANELGLLREFAGSRKLVVINARELRRLDFVAAGELLNEIVALKNANRVVTIDEPSHVVEALLVVMGIHELVRVRRQHH